MKSGRTLVDLAQELDRQIATKQDLVLPSSLLQCRTDEGGNLKLIVESGKHLASGGIKGGWATSTSLKTPGMKRAAQAQVARAFSWLSAVQTKARSPLLAVGLAS